MNRRHFLFTSAALAAGCSRRSPDPAVAAARTARDEHLAMLASFRVPADAVRTTPKPPVNVGEVFPSLKPLGKVAHRLHPRFGDEPGPDGSKLGGRLLWPAAEVWPADGESKLPFAAVLQLRVEDAPPQFPFRPNTDLVQLLWLPRNPPDGRPPVRVVWRKRAAVGTDLAPPPATAAADLGYVPVPCRLFPEKVAEFPAPDLMPRQMREQVEAWTPPAAAGYPGGLSGLPFFRTFLAAARGTKAGGWPRWPGDPAAPGCERCKNPTDYLLTVDSAEWGEADAARWRPEEERGAAEAEGFRRAAGLGLGGGNVQVFVCRRCPDWPAYAVGPE